MIRKKTIIFIILTCLFFLQGRLFSQKFDGGILAGGLVSQVDGDDWAGYSKLGYLVGGFVQLEISPNFSFQMEMEYIQKGSRKPSNIDSGDYKTYLLRLHYLEIPVLFQYTFFKRLSVEAGPAFDILLGSLEEGDGLEIPPDYQQPLRPVALAGIIGASVYITRHLKAAFRFNYSILSLRKPQPFGTPGTRHWRKIFFEWGQYNNVMSLSVSYQFKGRKNW